MNIAPFLAAALVEVDKAMQNSLDGTKLAQISDTISHYAIVSAVSSMGVALIPGAGGVAAALTQTGLVWATYVKINKTLGISMSEETVKFLGGAIATNLITQFGVVMVGHFIASLVACIPVFGGLGSAAAEAAIGYCLIYACAVIYLKLISALVKPDGTIDVSNRTATEESIRKIMQREDMKALIKEAGNNFNEAKKSGAIDAARKKRFCPNCGEEVPSDARFCHNCGYNLSKK